MKFIPFRLRARRLAFLAVFALVVATASSLEAQNSNVSINPPPPPNGSVGTAYSFTFTAAEDCDCSRPDFVWSYTGFLPGGLTLDANSGTLSGTPTGGGVYNASIAVTDSANNDQQAFEQVAITITGTPAKTSYVMNLSGDRVPVYQFITIPGGTTVSCGADADNCGPGNVTDMAIDSSGNFIVVVNQATDPPANSSIVKITPAGAVTVMNVDGTGQSNYTSIAIDAAGFYIVTDTSNATPRLLRFAPTVNSGGILVGALPVGAFDAYVRIDSSGNYVVAQDGDSGIAITRFSPAGVATPLAFTSGGSPFTPGGQVFGFTIDGNGNYVILETRDGPTQVVSITPAGAVTTLFSNENSDLSDPDGIFFDPDLNQFLITDDENVALYSLTPDGSALAQVPTGDGEGGNVLTNPRAVAAQVAPPAPPVTTPPPPYVPPVQISGPSSLGDFAIGKSISASFTVSGGVPPYSLAAGATPAGVSFSGATLSGTPTAPGTYLVSINATDSGGRSAYLYVSFSVLGLSQTSLPGASAFIHYSASVQAAGGIPPYTYSGTGTPAGIGVGLDGTIAGTATKTGTYSIAVTATDAGGVSASGTVTLVVSAPPGLKVPGGALTSATIQTPSSQVLTAAGGAPPYSWTIVSGAAPDGMALLTSGRLNGVPAKLGLFSFEARVTDSSGATATGAFSITVNPQPITINAPSPLPSGMVSVDYPVQTLTASGGTPPYQFTVTGGSPPPGLSLSTTGAISGVPGTPGNSSFTVTVSDSATPAATAAAALKAAIRPYAADLLLSAGAVAFSVPAGSTVVPPTEIVQIESTDTSQELGYSAVIPGGPSWLTIGTTTGTTTPGSIPLSLTSAALALPTSGSPYSASVVVTCTSGACNGRTQTVAVSLVVTTTPPQLTLVNDSLSFDTLASAPQASTETFGISNTGGGTLGIASITCGASWCQPSEQVSTIGGGATATTNVTADPTGLDPGYYYTSLLVRSSAGNASIPVTFQIAANGTLTLDPAGEQFSLPQGGAAVGETSFLVTITGAAAVSFNAAVAPGAPWLSVTPSSGTASGTQPADLNLVFDQTQIAALQPGNYYATVEITSTGAVNSPQSFEVVLNVTPPAAKTTPNLVPGGLLFLTQAGANPPSQTVAVYSGSPNATPYQASASTASAGSWLSVSPATGSTSSSAPGQATVTVAPGTLKPGVYAGTVNYSYPGAGVRSVNVTMIVEAVAAATPGKAAVSARDVPPPICTPTTVVPTSTALVSNFSAPAAWPVEMAITVVDDCGGAVAGGQVVVTFSNGDPPLLLNIADPAQGLYDGTWTPRHNASQTTITARASVAGLAASSIQIAGAVTPNNAPVLLHNSTANFFNPIGGAPLAPGTLIQLSGQYLASQNVTNSTIPVPTTLGGTSVLIGGIQAPVTFVSPGLIDAQVPFELPPGQPYQVIVNANGALTTPDGFEAGATSPGLSVQPDGLVRANHQDGTAVSETAPARPGEFISVYLVGLGATDVPVSSGAASPGSPVANASTPPAASLNGEPVSFDFAGLSPGLVGVYQVNLQIPSDAADGDLILSISSAGATSNSGVLPVHK
jgi:uncharacterized protein (TIGR03437 family)